MQALKVSIIVCTRNRAYAIVDCLNSIATALDNASLVAAEIVVVDNGSSDDTSQRIENWATTVKFPVLLLNEPRKGLSVARNRAMRNAHGELLVFTDDDCRLSGGYIQDLLRYDANDQELVLRGGRVELGDPSDLPLSIKTFAEEQRWNRHNAANRENLGDSLMGCNMTMRRELALRLGDFDERLGAGSRIPGGEDTDYLYRAYYAGHTLNYVPDMAVVHFHGRKTPAEGKSLFRGYALGWGALYLKYLLKYPELCRPLYWDIKNAIIEIFTQKNTFMPSVQFSHKDKVRYSIIGMLIFFYFCLCGVLHSNFIGRLAFPSTKI